MDTLVLLDILEEEVHQMENPLVGEVIQHQMKLFQKFLTKSQILKTHKKSLIKYIFALMMTQKKY